MPRKNPFVKNPIDAFPKCPSCMMDAFLNKSGFHVFCNYCEWNSVEAHAHACVATNKHRLSEEPICLDEIFNNETFAKGPWPQMQIA